MKTKLFRLTLGFIILLQLASMPLAQAKLEERAFYDPSVTGCGNEVSTAVTITLPASVPQEYSAIFAKAAAQYNINPLYLTAIFLSEHSNHWPSINGPWASSIAGASGPFQFMPGTWSSYQVDGNGDGVKDIQNIYDASYAAANLISKGSTVATPLGDINKPFARADSFVYLAGAYNWGPAAMERVRKTNPEAPITAAPLETQAYMKNIFSLMSSNLSKGAGAPRYPDPTSSTDSTSTTPPTTQPTSELGCSGSVVAGGVVQTALNFAWETKGHGYEKEDAKPVYRNAVDQYNKAAVGNFQYSDCGVFVATVMRATGADKDYPPRGTTPQYDYLKSHPEKYDTFDNINSTADLQPGDILIYKADPGEATGHTYIYTGPQSTGYSAVSASLHVRNGGHVPQVSETYFTTGGHHFMVARLKK